MAIPPLLANLIPTLAGRDDLLEIARNVYVAPAAPPPPPAPGLLADLPPGEAPAPVLDRSGLEPAPSLIGLRAPRGGATPSPLPSAEPWRPDPAPASPRAPAPARGTAQGSGPADAPAETARGRAEAPVETAPGVSRRPTVPGQSEPEAAARVAAQDREPEGRPSPARPGTGPVQASARMTQDAAPDRQDPDRIGGATVRAAQDAGPAGRDTVQNHADSAPIPPDDAPPRRAAPPPAPSSREFGSGGTVDAPAPDRDPAPDDAPAGGRPPAQAGDGPSAPVRTAERATVSEPASGPAPFAENGQGGQTERAGIIASCILNAAIIPGWPPPRPFAVPKAEELLVRFGQVASVPTEAEILARLKRSGHPPARRARLRQGLARLTKSRRLRTLLGLAALMTTLEAVLEAVEVELGLLARSGDDGDQPGAHEEGRRHLRL